MDSTNVQDISIDHPSDSSAQKDSGISQTLQNQQDFEDLNQEFQNLEIVLDINDALNQVWNLKMAEKYEDTLQNYRDYKIIINKLLQYFKNNIEKAKIFMYLPIDKQTKYTEEIAEFFYYLLMKDVKRIQAKNIIKFIEFYSQKSFKIEAFKIFADKCNISLTGYNLNEYRKKTEKTRKIGLNYNSRDIELFQRNTLKLLDILYKNQYIELAIAVDLLMIGDFAIDEVVNAKGYQVQKTNNSYIFRIYQQTFLNLRKSLQLNINWFHKRTQLQLDTFLGQNVYLVSLLESADRRSKLTQRLRLAKKQIRGKGYFQNKKEEAFFFSYLKNLKVDQIKQFFKGYNPE